MNLPINLKLAKLLKEKGYNNPCSHYYEHALTSRIDGETGNNTGAFGWEKGETHLHSHYFINNIKGVDFSDNNWYMCAAPTIAEVIDWIYEKKGVWVSVYTMEKWHENENEMIQYFDYTIKQMKLGLIVFPKKMEEFNSPTDAYEAAIGYCLTKLVK